MACLTPDMRGTFCKLHAINLELYVVPSLARMCLRPQPGPRCSDSVIPQYWLEPSHAMGVVPFPLSLTTCRDGPLPQNARNQMTANAVGYDTEEEEKPTHDPFPIFFISSKKHQPAPSSPPKPPETCLSPSAAARHHSPRPCNNRPTRPHAS